MDYADVHRVNSRGLAHLLLLCPTPNQQGRSGLLSARSSCTRGTETAMRAPPRGQGLVWLVPWRICLRQAGPSNRRRAKSDAWRRCLAQAAFPGSDPNRPYFHITQKHGSNIKFSNTEQCKNPIPRTWNTKPVMLLSENVEDHFRVVFS